MSLLAETERPWSGGIWFELSSLADSEFWFKLEASYDGIHPDFEARLFNEENGTQGWWDLGDFQRQNQPRSKFVTHSLLASSKLVFSDRYRPLQYPKRYFLEPEVEVWLDTIWRWGGAPKEFKRQIREEGETIWHLLPMCCGLSALVCRTLGNKCLRNELAADHSSGANYKRLELSAPPKSRYPNRAAFFSQYIGPGKKFTPWALRVKHGGPAIATINKILAGEEVAENPIARLAQLLDVDPRLIPNT